MYADADNWSTWDPEVKSASLEGEFASGTHGRLTPASGRPSEAEFIIVEVIPNESFALESRLPLCVVRFDHELTPTAVGTRALHRVTFRGILAPIFGPLVGNPIRESLPSTMAGLKTVVEERKMSATG